MDLVDEVLAGKVAAGARLIRWLEDEDPRAGAALARIYPHTGRAHLIGISGPPGAGKSTLAGMLIGGLGERGQLRAEGADRRARRPHQDAAPLDARQGRHVQQAQADLDDLATLARRRLALPAGGFNVDTEDVVQFAGHGWLGECPHVGLAD